MALGNRSAWLRAGLTITALMFALTSSAQAAPAIVPSSDAGEVAAALTAEAEPDLVTGASFVTRPDATIIDSTAVSDVPLTSFATDGPTYTIMSTGNPVFADFPNSEGNLSAILGGGSFQGTDNHDVTMLRLDVDVPDGKDCISLDYRFLSEEFDEFVGSGYNDSFFVQLDRSDWYANGSDVTAPGDFATSGEPIGVDSVGDYAVSPALAAGTTYDAATNLITAKTRVDPGPHSIYLTIFDQRDDVWDTAVFLDKLQTSSKPPGECEPPPVTIPTVTPSAKPPRYGPDSNIDKFQDPVKRKKLRSFSGTASADEQVARVEVALVRTRYGAKAAAVARKKRGRKKRHRRRPRCILMNSRRLMFQRKAVSKRCTRLEWVSVSGTTKWSFDLRRKLPKGRYTLYSRAIDKDGVAESSFSLADRNRVPFRVR